MNLRPVAATFLFLFLSPVRVTAQTPQACIYQTENGKFVQVKTPREIPERYRNSARCFSQRAEQPMANPSEIQLDGTIRREELISPVGKIHLRWPRKVELLFGRTPQRALADAAQTVSRAIKHAGFPGEIQRLNLEWQVVFMDETVPETQIPTYLVNNCHPAWMTPPANIYVVAQRVVAGCGGNERLTSKVADGELAQILIHEMGHAIESQLLGGRMSGNRMQHEGFATWFERYAAEYSSVIANGKVRTHHEKLAREAVSQSPSYFSFSGSPYDYARASMYFEVIVERSNVRRLMEVYEVMAKEGLDFFSAVTKRLGWNEKRLETEVVKRLGLA